MSFIRKTIDIVRHHYLATIRKDVTVLNYSPLVNHIKIPKTLECGGKTKTKNNMDLRINGNRRGS